MTEIEAGPIESRSLMKKKFDSEFTFRPKISSNSQKMTENISADFLTRQQNHIDKQKKLYEQALQGDTPDRPRRIRLSYGNPQLQTADSGAGSDDQSSPTAEGSKELGKKTSPAPQLLDGQAGGEALKSEGKKRSKSLPPKAKGQQQQGAEAAAAVDRGDGDVSPRLGNIGGRRRRRSSAGGGGGGGEQRLRRAKETAEAAIRDHRVFTILGPYPRVREFLRTRGWVEKFFIKEEDKMQTLRRSIANSSGRQQGEEDAFDAMDDGGDDGDGDGDGDGDDLGAGEDGEEGKIPPWEEEGGVYGLMSRMARNIQPTFIWSLRKDQVDFKFLRKDQIVNHFGRAGCFTTKIGLCRSLRELPWYDCESAEIFYPRCYVLSSEEEKEAFMDDYRITACMSLLRLVGEDADKSELSSSEDAEESCDVTDDGASQPPSSPKKEALQASPAKASGGGGSGGGGGGGHHKDVKRVAPKIQFKSPRPAAGEAVPKSVLETAIAQCERLIQDKNHDNLDEWDPAACMSESDWFSFLQSFYRVAHNGARIRDSASLKSKCRDLCSALRAEFPQFDIDGCRNAWIVKPGAKSRGRGIICVRTLESVMEMVGQTTSSVGVSANKLVVQKYIERPLLIHRTKFDIRQWFVVTDFNPLTIWWYKDCYVRFCSQHFTLNDFNEAVHLSNNSIQYKYINQANRHPDLPDDNIWDSMTFQTHLASIGQPDVYYDVIYPGMQKAVINSMLCSQDHVEIRKNCFELYGADFMIADTFQPWLLEINCSPTMAPSTIVTTRLCRNVQEDILKVIIDRRVDKNCDTGRFELIYKQQQVNTPIYAGIDLTLLGQSVKRPWNISVVPSKPERSVSLFAEERRLDREKLAAPANQRQPRGRGPAGVGAVAGEEAGSGGSESSSQLVGHVTKLPNPKLVSVANRKPPTKVEIIPINTGLPKKSTTQPSYFRSKRRSQQLERKTTHLVTAYGVLDASAANGKSLLPTVSK